MKEVKRYKCDYCKTLRATTIGIERHEKQCIHNPNSINCYRCAQAYEGEAHNDYGRNTGMSPMCAYHEDVISENIAAKCDNYKIDNKPYFDRRVCPDIF